MDTKPLSLRKEYNPEIDIWKFVFAVFLFLYHTKLIYEGYPSSTLGLTPFSRGYLCVEFYFMVSGYFMAAKIRSDARKGLRTPADRFLLRKLQVFYKVMFAAFLIGFAGREMIAGVSIFGAARDLILGTAELGFGRMLGLIIVRNFNGPDWYIASMMIALAVIYPLAAKYRRAFFRVACPLIALAGWGMLCQIFGTVTVTEEVALGGFLMGGLIRAAAGICAGALVNELSAVVKEKELRPNKAGNVIFALIELGCIALIVFQMHFAEKLNWKKQTDFGMLPVIALFLFIVFSEFTGVKKLLSKLNLTFLSRLSLYLYLNHRVVIYILIAKAPAGKNPAFMKIFGWYVGLTACTMLLCRILVAIINVFFKKYLPKLRTALFRQPAEAPSAADAPAAGPDAPGAAGTAADG